MEATIDGVHNVLFSGVAASIAGDMDARIATGNDNYDIKELPTTGGCLDLATNKPTADAAAVVALENAGAIILGKTNLHELALEGLTVSSLEPPGGSSGGTGAEIASSFAVFGTGSDTANSLRSPASANSLFAFRPTRGLISCPGIIPVSYTQDAIGPIARNVKDLAVALNVMASTGFDPLDNTTGLRPPSLFGTDYSKDTPSNETTPVNDIMNYTISVLQKAGVEIHGRLSPDAFLNGSSSSLDDFTAVESFLSSTICVHSPPINKLDAIIYLEQTNLVVKIASPSQIGRNGILTALTGFPVVTVPAGFSPPIDHAPIGAPIGMEILGLPWSESMLINIASHISALAHANICKHVG
ncbi:amidase [Hyaloscypha sp. PMI_1271]|nr:amidase [Hyaloscypha sp. PMI_1271]